eukprot:GHVL01037611.1.p1 GENE.GHVL01037611.1~~GHVL01037611.1.p1  ORF type:complete len:620 (+),score=143.18 GHVL01037611.1:1766-3625(+)
MTCRGNPRGGGNTDLSLVGNGQKSDFITKTSDLTKIDNMWSSSKIGDYQSAVLKPTFNGYIKPAMQQPMGVSQIVQNELEMLRERLGSLNVIQRQAFFLRSRLMKADAEKAEIQNELNQVKESLQQCRSNLNKATQKLEDKDSLLSDTRKRLFQETERNAELKRDMRDSANKWDLIQQKLFDSRAEKCEVERKMLHLQHIFETTNVLALPEDFTPIASKPYSDRLTCSADDRNSSLIALDAGLRVESNDELANVTENGFNSSLEISNPKIFEDENISSPKHQLYFSPTPPGVWQATPEFSLAQNNADLRKILPQVTDCSRNRVELMIKHFRNLILNPRGVLYEDDNLRLSFECEIRNLQANVRLVIMNIGSHFLQQVQLSINGHIHGVIIEIENNLSGSNGMMRPQGGSSQTIAKVLVNQPYEGSPQVLLTYVMADGCPFKTAVALPLTVTKFMEPVNPSPRQFFTVWNQPEFVVAKFAFQIPLRTMYSEVGGLLQVTRCLELGGAALFLPGFDSNPNSVVGASTFWRGPAVKPLDCLIRIEISKYNDKARVEIRSASYTLNKAVAVVLAELLSAFPKDRKIEDSNLTVNRDSNFENKKIQDSIFEDTKIKHFLRDMAK